MATTTMKYEPAELAAMLRSGKAHKTPNGTVVPLGDAQDLADAITHAGSDPVLRQAIGRRTRELHAEQEAAKGGNIHELAAFLPSRVDGVRAPATGASFLMMKSAAGQQAPPAARPEGVHGAVIKTDGARRFTLTIAYPADRPDVAVAQDGYRDYASKQAVEEAAWHYLVRSPKVGLWHADHTEGAGDGLESCIWRADDWQVGGQVVKAGDWLLGVQWSPATWELIKAGKVGGVSMQGTATRRLASAEAVAALRKSRAELARRGALLAKAARYDRMASVMSNQSEAAGYRQLAEQARQEAGAA